MNEKVLKKTSAFILLAALIVISSSCAGNEKANVDTDVTDTNTKDTGKQSERVPEIQVEQNTSKLKPPPQNDIKPMNMPDTPKSNVKPLEPMKTEQSRPPVKMEMSEKKICYQRGNPNYNNTEFFAPYDTLKECLADGGTLPNSSPPETTKDEGKTDSLQDTQPSSAPSPPITAKDDETSTYSSPSGEPPPVKPSVQTSLPVKMSKSGICHAPGTTYYDRTTKNYTPYNSLQECLAAGGREPER